jgi:hypothetical protein
VEKDAKVEPDRTGGGHLLDCQGGGAAGEFAFRSKCELLRGDRLLQIDRVLTGAFRIAVADRCLRNMSQSMSARRPYETGSGLRTFLQGIRKQWPS